MFAIIRTGGKQYKVSKDSYLNVEKLEGKVGDAIKDIEILMVSDGDKTTIGAGNFKISAEILEQFRDEKVIIFKKRRRQNYRRKNGHRQHLTKIKITDIKAA